MALSVETEVTGYPRDAAKRKCMLGGGIEVPCIYRFYGPKKSKTEFRNKLDKLTDNKLAFIASRCFMHLDDKSDIFRI